MTDQDQRRADMLAAAPWIRDALKSTNAKAKLFEAQANELVEKNDALTRTNGALKAQLLQAEQHHEVELRELREKLENASALIRKLQMGGATTSGPANLSAASGLDTLTVRKPSAAAEEDAEEAEATADAQRAEDEDKDKPVFADIKGGLGSEARWQCWKALLASEDGVGFCMALGQSCKVADLDEVVNPVLAAMEAVGKTVSLINVVVGNEVEQQKEITTLFRTNSFASKLLKGYTQLCGGPFVAAALQKGIQRVLAMDVALEVDTAKVSADVAETNAGKLTQVCEEFIDDIVAALAVAPHSMRMICAHISSQVGAKFGREDRVRALGIGAYVFLRMLCPTFLAPEKAVTISRAVEAHHLRTFILVSKVIQNLANQVLFGKKEVFMLPLNAVVKSQQERVNTFLLEMAQIPPAPGDGGGKKPIDSDAMNAIQSLAQSSKASLAETPMYSKQTTLNVGVYVSFLTQLSLTKLTPPSTSCIYGETEQISITLMRLLTRWNHAVGLGVALVSSASRLGTCAALFEMYDACKLSISFTKSMVSGEIACRDGGTAVASGDEPSAASMVFSRLFLRWGKELLKDTIGASVHQIVQGNLRLEIDSAQVRSVDNLSENVDSLIGAAKNITEGILGALSTLPAVLWGVMNVQSASAKAASNKTALGDLGMPAAFICESFIVPALKNPVDYWLTSRVPRPEAERTLELLVALVRLIFGSPLASNAANLSQPLLLQFANQNKAAVQQFVEEWAALQPSELPCKWARPQIAKRSWPDAATFFRVHDILFNNRLALRSVLPKTLQAEIPVAVTVADLLA